MAIGAPGAFNAAIFAIQILALSDNVTGQKIQDWRNDITTRVKDEPNKTIGILGGGQLAKMLAISAANPGFNINILSLRDYSCSTSSSLK